LTFGTAIEFIRELNASPLAIANFFLWNLSLSLTNDKPKSATDSDKLRANRPGLSFVFELRECQRLIHRVQTVHP